MKLLKLISRIGNYISLILFTMVLGVELTDFLSGIDIADLDAVHDVLIWYLYTAMTIFVASQFICGFHFACEIKKQVDMDIFEKRNREDNAV